MIPRSRVSAVDSTTAGTPTWRSTALAVAVLLAVALAALAVHDPAIAGALLAGAGVSALGRPVVRAVRRAVRPSKPPAACERPERT